MLTSDLKEKYHPLKIEVIDSNVSMHFLKTKMQYFEDSLKISRDHMLFVIISWRYIENGLIMHLTNLDDERSSQSFHSARKDLERINSDPTKLKKLKTKIKVFRQEIRFLKNDHRNIRIAHINHRKIEDIPEMYDFIELSKLNSLVKMANEIGDMLWGQEIKALFKMGSIYTEGYLDFRTGQRIYVKSD
ncbi:hypothetical protein FHS59_004044 [Algoriphagus iocasae]|uniref:HEPN AbiU2-like domain-containing protein n=1 Tax=Algoriphagus iocasae TaxID=1836499 RepID=A0A841N2L0_9BACT|nr:hypothetical protein [Algoriphagus iocasae]MBB6328401.1 hypothetical protein [Algoriphagus iocasae]